jgi:hypothetical protein
MDDDMDMDLPTTLSLSMRNHHPQVHPQPHNSTPPPIKQQFSNPFDWEGISLPSNPSQQSPHYAPPPSNASPSAFLSFPSQQQYAIPGIHNAYPQPPPLPSFGGASSPLPFLPPGPTPEVLPNMYDPNAHGSNQQKRRHD